MDQLTAAIDLSLVVTMVCLIIGETLGFAKYF